jgi:hypothetical protein
MKAIIQHLKLPSPSILAMIIIVMGGISCSKNEDTGPSAFIKTQDIKVTYSEINGCNLAGTTYTEFYITIPYETSPDIEIEKILFSLSQSIQGEQQIIDFDNNGLEIGFPLCLKFGLFFPHLDLTTTIVSTNGVKSNPFTYRINRPQGAF